MKVWEFEVGIKFRKLNTVCSESHCALIKVLEAMSMSAYTGPNPFNSIRKYFLQICVRKVTVHL
jgi:hypothetical protein